MSKQKQKPQKPRKDFPLGAASNGQWCRKIRGRVHYFGVWASPDDAEAEYLRQREYLFAGRLPPAKTSTGIRLNELCNKFLNAKKALRDSGELSGRTFVDYFGFCAEVVDHFGGDRLVEGVAPEDFNSYRVILSQGRGLHFIAKRVTLTKMLFGFAYSNELIEKPIRFGQQFAKPSLRSMRIHRAKKQHEHGLRMLEAAEIRLLLAAASVPLKAMVLLAANGGFGNSDLANLPQSAIQGQWLQYPRVKTGVDRRIPLWPETLLALTEAIKMRPRAKDPVDAGLCFLTQQGRKWVRFGANGTSICDSITDLFSRTLGKLNLKVLAWGLLFAAWIRNSCWWLWRSNRGVFDNGSRG